MLKTSTSEVSNNIDDPRPPTPGERITVEIIAETCHNANRAYCAALGDDSQVDWMDAPEWQRESAINGVVFHIEGIGDKTPEDSHANWLKEKEADGWKYGPVKDVIKKEHPCFLPYDQLPPNQRIKDYIFAAIAKSLGQHIFDN